MGIVGDRQGDVFNIVAGIMHLGNISFTEKGNYAVPEDDGCELCRQSFVIVQFLLFLLFFYTILLSVDIHVLSLSLIISLTISCLFIGC